MVPIPSSVKTSSSSECGTRPSSTCAAVTPPRTARRQASILGTMPDGERRQQLLELVGGDLADRPRSRGRPVGVQALDVGEHDQLLRIEADGQRGGGGVGVDVVDPAVLGRGRRWRRPGSGRRRSGASISLGSTADDVADQADVDRLAVDHRRRGARPCSVSPSSPDMPTANGPCALIRPTISRCDLADQHHADDVHRLGRGDPQAAGELALDAEPFELRG